MHLLLGQDGLNVIVVQRQILSKNKSGKLTRANILDGL